MSSIFINVEVDVNQLSEEIVGQFSEDQCFELIKNLEEAMASWDFLKRLHKHFKEIAEKESEDQDNQ